MGDATQLASLDGALMPAGEAMIPATDDGLLRGDGVFEVIRLYDGRPFALEDHLRRLALSAQNMRLEFDAQAVRGDIERLLEEVAREPGREVLRIVLTRGGRRLLLTEPLPAMRGRVRLGSITYAPTRVLDGIKSLSYGANMLAGRLAREAGFDEALLVTPHGRVLEAPTSTIFWVQAGAVFTPPLDEHILASITRAVLMELTDAQERNVTLSELIAADEAFLASTLREVQGVESVDGTVLGDRAPVTRRAAERFRERVAAELPSH